MTEPDDERSPTSAGQDGSPPLGRPVVPGTGAGKPALFDRAPGPVLYGLTVLAGAGFLISSSDPAGSGDVVDGLIGLTLLVCVGAWLVRLVGFLVHRRRGSTASRGLWFLLGPVMIAVLVALARSSAPVRLRWSWSRHDFQRAVQAAPSAPQAGKAPLRFTVPRHLGWYDVTKADRYPWGIVCENAGSGVDHWGGFAYLPNGKPNKQSDWTPLTLRSLGGGWYAWSNGF